MRQRFMMVAALALVLAAVAPAATYDIDTSHSSVEFKVRHMMVSNVRGGFGDFSGTIEFDEADPGSWSAEATIQMASVDTGDQKRDDHLRNPDFFDVETYPTMVFKSTGVKQQGDDLQLHGDLTLRGVTKSIVLDLVFNGSIEDPWGNTRTGFSAEGKIDRKDFDVNFDMKMDKGGLVVGDDVSIYLEIEAIKRK